MLNISERQADDVMFLILSGDLIFGEENEILRNSIRHQLNEGHTKIILDMKAVGYVDSSGLGELISGFTAITRKNGEFKLVNLPPRFRQLLEMCRLSSVFDTGE